MTLNTQVQVPVERVTKLRPSEAMRLGRMLYPESCTGDIARRTPSGWAVCALGAIAVGMGWQPGDDDESINEGWKRSYEHLDGQSLDCPDAGRCPAPSDWKLSAGGIVFHLNDTHKWASEQTASWLESIGL